DSGGRIYTVALQDDRGTGDPADDLWRIEIRSAGGTLLNTNFITNLPSARRLPSATSTNLFTCTTLLAIQPAAGCSVVSLFVLHNGDLTRYNAQGQGTLLASGFGGH